MYMLWWWLYFLSSHVVCFASEENVVVLDASNFDTIVNGDKHVLVEFYAPWCGHCKNLAPTYELVGTTFKKATDVVIAKVDADAQKSLGGRFNVEGFPTLKFFPKGATDPMDYTGGRTETDLVKFVNDQAGTQYRVVKPPSSVQALTLENFDAIALDPSKHVLVEFYAPWCGHCKQLAPKYEQLGQVFAGEPHVVIAHVDADAHKTLASRYGVSGFPTLKYFGPSTSSGSGSGSGSEAEPEAYSGGRTVQDLVSFMNDKAKTHRTAEGGLMAHAGRIDAIDVILSDHGDVVTQDVVSKAEKIIDDLEGEAVQHGHLYVKAMKKIISRGQDYVDTEIERLEGMIQSDAVKPQKKTLFQLRQNILRAFRRDE